MAHLALKVEMAAGLRSKFDARARAMQVAGALVGAVPLAKVLAY